MNFKDLFYVMVVAGMIVNCLFIALVFFTIGTEGSMTIHHLPEDLREEWNWTVWIEFVISLIILIGAFMVGKQQIDRRIDKNIKEGNYIEQK